MFRFFKKKSDGGVLQGNDGNEDCQNSAEWSEFIKLLRSEVVKNCNNHLLYIKTNKDDAWDEAEKENDIETIITHFSGAIDGTEAHVNTIFKPLEDTLRQAGGEGGNVWNYVRMTKLAHMIQVRMYFEFRLKSNLLPEDRRQVWREKASEILNPTFRDEI